MRQIVNEVILGGGLGGLSAAYYYIKKYPQKICVLLESSDRLGGWIRSYPTRSGPTFEQGPRTIRPVGFAGANTLQLLQELELQNKIIFIPKTHPAALNRMVYAEGSLHLLPSDLSGLFFKRAPFSKPLIAHLLKDITTPGKLNPAGDESVYDFVERRFGSEIADYLISPLLCGICAGNAKEISVKFLMKSLFEYEQKHGSITKGVLYNLFSKKEKNNVPYSGLMNQANIEKWSIYSFTNGMQTLPETLNIHLKNKGVALNLNSTCNEMTIENDKIFLTLNDKQLESSHLISSIPASSLANLVVKQHKDLANLLKDIKSVTVAVVNLYFERNLIPFQGFGFLVAPKENLPILGVIYDSCCFPNTQGTVFTIMMGGYWFEEKFGKHPDEQQLLQVALKQLQTILAFSDEPIEYKVNILRNCIPQYTIGHYERVKAIEDYIKSNKLPITLCGSSYYGVGINDVILSARNAVSNL